MGTQDQRSVSAGDMTDIEAKRALIQEQIDRQMSVDDRRKEGQFSTPIDLASEIIGFGSSLLPDEGEIAFLEPAIGTGSFYSALLRQYHDREDRLKSVGIELDASIYRRSVGLWRGHDIHLVNADFTSIDTPFSTFDFVVTNPPYVRHQLLTSEQKAALKRKVKNDVSIEVSGLSGLYCYYILLAHKWLRPGAVCGWLIPSEFMDVNYGIALKDYLLDVVRLIRIHRYDPSDLRFRDALVSSCVVWFKNETPRHDDEVEFSYGGTHRAPHITRSIAKSSLRSGSKWTGLFEDRPREMRGPCRLGDYFTIKRGIATGDNDFFILTREQIAEHDLEMDYFVPILPSPRKLREDEIFADDDGLPLIEDPLFLLDISLEEAEIRARYPSLWAYLQSGAGSTAQKYLCKKRKIWYSQERRDASPFLCSYMGRGRDGTAPFRFFYNHSDAIAANSFLMMYPNEILSSKMIERPSLGSALWKMLRSLPASAMVDEGRIYGGGLKKIEPRELCNVPIGDIYEIIYS